MLPSKSRKVLVWVRIVLLELLDNILADIGVVLFYLLSPAWISDNSQSLCQRSHRDLHLQLVLWRDGMRLSPITQKLLDEAGDVPSCNGDMFDG